MYNICSVQFGICEDDMSQSQFTLKDWSNENSTASFYSGDITAASLPGFLTQFGALRSAIEGITLGTMHKERWIGDDTLLSNDLPASGEAQREKKWLVTYRGVVNDRLYTLEIPTADLGQANILLPGSDRADPDHPSITAFVSAFEAIGRSPDSATENIEVVSLTFVGRNL